MAVRSCTFSALFLLLSNGNPTVAASRLIGAPPGTPKYLQFGETLGVTCSPDSTDSAQELKWYGPNIYFPGNGEPNLIRSRSDMPVEPGESVSRVYSQFVGSNLRLYIVRITSQDTGLYNCTGRVDNIPAHWSFELHAFDGITLEADPDRIVIHGEDSLIRCIARSQPAPETDWYFNGVFIDPLVNTKYALSHDGLIVRNPEFTDSGLYECVGTETTLGTIKQQYINVEVVTRPRMLTPPPNTTGIRWRDARILCNASSIPAPNYRWYDGTPDSKGTEITAGQDGDRFRVSGTNGDLNIVDVHIEDEQWYWCEAYNKAGTVTGKAYFEVQMIPVFMDDNNLNKTETHAGNTVEMICQSEAKPNARMSFRREGYNDRYINGFQTDDQRIYVYEKSSSAQQGNRLITPQEVVIRINNTTPKDTANYTCIAENSSGKNETQMHIIIQHVPKFDLMTDALRTQCIWEDHPRNITALLSGYPQPSVTWSRGDGRAITPGKGYKIYFEPYWENGRRDEWLANLEINWQVFKTGLQVPVNFNPIGNYFPVSTNNLGTNATTVTVKEASLPGRPRSVNATFKNAQSIVLAAEPPVEDKCIQVTAFEIVYRKHGTGNLPRSLLFNLDEKRSMRIGGLESGASYMFEVYARNERGRGRLSKNLKVDTLASNGPTCPDKTTICSKNAMCGYTWGGKPEWNCTCKAGYLGNGHKCTDINECARKTDDCNNDAVCQNTDGGFTCKCKDGFSDQNNDGRVGYLCEDINECIIGNDDCDPHADCKNTIGGYTCTCRDGFNDTSGLGRNGTKCADVDECTLQTHDCDINADCNNTIGGFICTCRDGYNDTSAGGRSGTTCTDNDECREGSDLCDDNADCTNIPGSYNCTCRQGYNDISSNGTQCQDLDECTLQTHDCDYNSNCENTIGGYTCTCNPGYNDISVSGRNGTKCEDPWMKRRVEFRASYSINCGHLKNPITLSTVKILVKDNYKTIQTICQQDCGIDSNQDAVLSCENGNLSVTWPTDSVYKGIITTLPSDIQARLRGEIKQQHASTLRLVILDRTPPIVYPSLTENGGYVKATLTIFCLGNRTYQAENDSCV